ncbi:hypothetical protein FAES_0388 [Fibrella aestuarina BUZ 2]|uniref:ZU5 domain-containing protein n=1 Tax=Fibrella aestuarina BUZ 2 TaxID=1166018 RepID=I0K2P7_9BACT|nr:hypothetical protein [Fibrella aestuarina]CCG98400.1 hypothetical protein FAES_0388 [Fibrella aestuarina BUZ 2]
MRLFRLLPILLASLLACTKPADITPTQPATGTPTEVGKPIGAATTKTIGAAGGSLTTSDGKLTLTFPAGALANETLISVQPVENKAINGVGIAYEFGPDGSRFAKPVTFTYHYAPTELLGTTPQAMALASQNAEHVWLLERFVKVDPVSRTIQGKIDHFSWWSIITLFYMTPEAATLGPTNWVDLKIQQAADLPTIPTSADADQLPLLAPLTLTGTDPFLIKDISLNGNNNWSALQNSANPDGYLGYDMRAKAAVIRYYAPARVPQNNPVMIGVTLAVSDKAQLILVGNLTIENENSFSVEGRRFDNVQVAAGFVGGTFTLTMRDLDDPTAMGTLYAQANLSGEGSASFDLNGNGAAAATNRGETQGDSRYRTCADAYTESGTITITKLVQKNGQRYVQGTVRGTLVKIHDVDRKTCTVLEHKTFQVSANFTAPLL